MDARASRRTSRDRLKFWLVFALVYTTGTLGFGRLTHHPFGLWQWVLLTACILGGQGAAKMAPRLIRLITDR